MKSTTPGFKHLTEIGQFNMSLKDASDETRIKIIDTAKYALECDPTRDRQQLIHVTTASLLAEQYVASHMEGSSYSGVEDINDPFTFAFDVLSHIKYQGLRIEVKCAFSNKWVNIRSSNHPSNEGISLDAFLASNVADVMIIFLTQENQSGVFTYRPGFVIGRDVFTQYPDLIKRGRDRKSWYLCKNFYVEPECPLTVFK